MGLTPISTIRKLLVFNYWYLVDTPHATSLLMRSQFSQAYLFMYLMYLVEDKQCDFANLPDFDYPKAK